MMGAVFENILKIIRLRFQKKYSTIIGEDVFFSISLKTSEFTYFYTSPIPYTGMSKMVYLIATTSVLTKLHGRLGN